MCQRLLRRGTSTSYRILSLVNTACSTGLRAGEMFNMRTRDFAEFHPLDLGPVLPNTPHRLSHLAISFATIRH